MDRQTEYGTCVDSASLYVCMEVTEPRDVRFYGKIGVAGWRESINFSDVTPSDNLDPVATTDLAPSNWQRFYVTGHVLWDVDVDEAALLEDAESRYYGAAYPAMRKYQDLRRRLWLNNSFCYGYSVGTDRAVRQLDAPLAEERLSGWLDEAERLAADDERAARHVLAVFEHFDFGERENGIVAFDAAPHITPRNRLRRGGKREQRQSQNGCPGYQGRHSYFHPSHSLNSSNHQRSAPPTATPRGDDSHFNKPPPSVSSASNSRNAIGGNRPKGSNGSSMGVWTSTILIDRVGHSRFRLWFQGLGQER